MIILIIFSMVGFKGGYLTNNKKNIYDGRGNTIITQEKAEENKDNHKLKIWYSLIIYDIYFSNEHKPFAGTSIIVWYNKIGMKMKYGLYQIVVMHYDASFLWRPWRDIYVGVGWNFLIALFYPVFSSPVFSMGIEKNLWSKNVHYFLQIECGYPWYDFGLGDAPAGWVWKSPPLMFSIGLNFYTYVF